MRSILGSNEVNSGPYSRPSLGNLRNCLHLAVGRPPRLNMTKYGSWDEAWVVYRYSPPSHPPGPHHPGYTPPSRTPEHQVRYGVRCSAGGVNSAVGLKSVDRLSLDVHISGFQGMTEVYNLVRIEDPNDHNVIPGTD